jgi:hypothetical protein
MNTRLLLIIAIVGILGCLVFLYHRENDVRSGWASMNAAMAHHQDDPKPLGPVLVKDTQWSDYVLLGWPSKEHAHQYEWIILDSTPGGNVMRTPPNGKFVLPCAYLAKLANQAKIDRTVQAFLAGRCSKE